LKGTPINNTPVEGQTINKVTQFNNGSSSMTIRDILFSKYKDPYGRNIKHDEEDAEEDTIDDDEELLEMGINKPGGNAYISTPMGLVSVNEYTNPAKIFNMWTGETNFTLTEPIVKKIEDVDGVEILDCFTRYRFRFAVGRLFDDNAVREAIRKSICEEVKPVHTPGSFDIREVMKEVYDG